MKRKIGYENYIQCSHIYILYFTLQNKLNYLVEKNIVM